VTLIALLSLAATMPQGAFADRCSELIGDRGAVAVMDLATGQLIAATDPEILFAERYPPGSVAKIVTGLLALQNDLELPDEFQCYGFQCYGFEVAEQDTLWCSVRTGHGKLDFSRALSQSCNLYFQNLAAGLSAEELAGLWRELRLDEKVGVDLPGEVESVIETPLTDSAKLAFAVGQGSAIQLTPVAMLALISGIATQGQLLRPRLSQGPPQVLSSFPSQKALARIRPILRDVVRSGTASAANISTVQVAGKTGSSTVLDNWVTHGWFVGFAPYEAPKIAVVVFLNRGEGKDAARIAGIVFSDYFRGAYAER
jgi:cell division protein FtsI/penicillin-binding protein 2